MSAKLSFLLGRHEGAIAKFINRAEQLCGYPGEDIRLMTTNSQKIKQKIAELNLDPADTTGRELYWALRAKAEADRQEFVKALGLDGRHARTARLINLQREIGQPPILFVLRKTTARALLKDLPPKQLIKRLSYRSNDSMIKREDISALVVTALKIESTVWQKNFRRALKDLKASDFEERPLELLRFSDKLSGLTEKDLNVCFLLGAILLKRESVGEPLNVFLQIFEAEEKLRSWSLAVSFKQFDPKFGDFVRLHAAKEPKNAAVFADLPLDYSNLHQNSRTTLRKLTNLQPSLKWWQDNEALAEPDKQKPVSLNLRDILGDHSNSNSFADRQADYFKKSFWDQLLSRYLKYPNFRREALNEIPLSPVFAEESAEPGAAQVSKLLENA